MDLDDVIGPAAAGELDGYAQHLVDTVDGRPGVNGAPRQQGRTSPVAMPVTLCQLRCHLGGDQVDVVEVGDVQHLQVETGHAGLLPPPPDGVHDLRR